MKTVRLPIRILCKARDMYIKNMVDCSGRLGYGEGVVCHSPPEAPRLPKSFSVGSSCFFEEDEISAMADLMYPRRRNLIVHLNVLDISAKKKQVLFLVPSTGHCQQYLHKCLAVADLLRARP